MIYVTRQLDALRLLKSGTGVSLNPAYRGAFHPPSVRVDGEEYVITTRVWERLLDRGDAVLYEGHDYSKTLFISDQGLSRLASADS